MKWNTEEIVKLLTHPDWKISTTEPGGDVDTTNLIVDTGNDRLFICGFSTGDYNVSETPYNAEIEMIEVSDGRDSRGGLNSSDEATCIAYGIICSRLRKAGFSVVPRLKDYF